MSRFAINSLILATLLFAAGCSSHDRDLNVWMELDSDDPSLSLGQVEFVHVGRSMGCPQVQTNGKVLTCTERTHSINGIYLVVEVNRNNMVLRSEVYKVDPAVLRRIGTATDWLSPDFASIDDDVSWILMHNLDALAKLGEDTEFVTKIRLKVKKPLHVQ